MPDAKSNDPKPLTPEARARDVPAGIPAVLGDGQTWILARCGLARAMEPIRDEFYTSMMLSGGVKGSTILGALFYSLAINYELDDEEIGGLIDRTSPATVVEQVREAIVPLVTDAIRADFSEWARSALFANGLNPADIPEADLPWVLEQLMQTGRAIPHHDFTAAGIAGGVRDMAKAMAKQYGAKLPTE